MGRGGGRSDTGGDGGGVDDGWVHEVGGRYIYHVGDRGDEYWILGMGGERPFAYIDCFLGFREKIGTALGIDFGMRHVSIYTYLCAVP